MILYVRIEVVLHFIFNNNDYHWKRVYSEGVAKLQLAVVKSYFHVVKKLQMADDVARIYIARQCGRN